MKYFYLLFVWFSGAAVESSTQYYHNFIKKYLENEVDLSLAFFACFNPKYNLHGTKH